MKGNWGDLCIKILGGLLAIIAVIITLGTFIAINRTYEVSFWTKLDKEEIGNVGSFLSGFVGVFWSILSSVLVFYALFRQTKEFKKQQEAIEKQQFEGTFFNMLNTLSSITSSIKDDSLVGRAYIESVINQLMNKYEAEMNDEIKKIEDEVCRNIPLNTLKYDSFKSYVSNIYEDVYSGKEHLLGHYLRYIYNLMKFVVKERKEKKDEMYYINLIQAQLSDVELSLIFYNALSKHGLNSAKENQFFKLLEHYRFLENVNDKSLMSFSTHCLYKNTVFKFLNNDQKKLKQQD